nr:pro-neuregulin-3, membrane-bound isoform [Dromaius novaehollandiae]
MREGPGGAPGKPLLSSARSGPAGEAEVPAGLPNAGSPEGGQVAAAAVAPLLLAEGGGHRRLARGPESSRTTPRVREEQDARGSLNTARPARARLRGAVCALALFLPPPALPDAVVAAAAGVPGRLGALAPGGVAALNTTTYSTERSEHFKPCKDKDLAYCLNEGECFVIETLTGSHKHCRCKEGYQGVRCDQFLPKTDSILSDPTDHLGIEFMESEEVYQRQVLSISCIVFGIVVVGMLCAAFYFKAKKETKQIHEQLKETQNRKTYSLNASSMMAKSECMAQSRVQLQHYSKADRRPGPMLDKVMESSFSGPPSFPEALSPDRGTQPIKQHRSLSSCCSPGQKGGILHKNAFRRTPPLPRGRFNGITGPAYQQLEESRITDQDTIPCQRYSSSGLKTPQNTSINMQLPSRETTPYFNNVDQKDLVGYSSSRANSVPIIPSVGLDEACMQMQNVPEVTGIKWCKNSYSAELVNVSSPVSNCLIAEQHEVKILLETVQEQIRILTDARRSEDYELASLEPDNSASENTAFLPMSPVAKSEREAQFVLKSETQRDSVLTK